MDLKLWVSCKIEWKMTIIYYKELVEAYPDR